MCPNVVQFLTYMAGRTRRAQLGSMVMVLPWHDPVRLAEEISVLDTAFVAVHEDEAVARDIAEQVLPRLQRLDVGCDIGGAMPEAQYR